MSEHRRFKVPIWRCACSLLMFTLCQNRVNILRGNGGNGGNDDDDDDGGGGGALALKIDYCWL